ncbi:MAG TPA: adenylate/guanylate cyclase domain-containing protein [Solirubrobacterales bacterium]
MSNRTGDDAERKQVTVLFADVSGSMDLAEGRDPEEWAAIMQRFFAILADAVAEFEGTVDKFTGDGIMAVFGAPVAHEDHAQRACYAALRMLDDVAGYAAELRRNPGLNFSTRIGISSGEVVAGAIGGGDGAYTAIGHTVGLAQRMEALAEPGKAYLTESTAALATGFLELDDLGEFEIKGASRPVRVYELAGVGHARSRLDLARERGFSRFVGRDAELALLAEALDRAEAGDGAVVGLVAEPGVGKSRLLRELAERQHQREGIEVFEAQAQSHGAAIPYSPILQMLRSFFEIGEREPERAAREKVAGRTLLLDQSFASDLPLMFDFLGFPDPERPLPQMRPEARQRALAEILCRLVNPPNRRKTLVLVVEDMHWIDPASEAMLAELVATVAGTKTLVLFNYRPEYAPPWAGAEGYRELALEPLTALDTAALLRDVAGSDPSLHGIETAIHERTGGNPFFIEEVVRELAECGYLSGEPGAYRLAQPIDDAGVPAAVQAILAARIDRLGAEAKALLQVAAVIGLELREVLLRLAAGLPREEAEATLRELVDGGFLYEAELFPERTLAFRHPLTREVAYGSQLAERRARTHAAVARATVELESERLEELAGLIAHHFEQGGEPREAARWYSRAAHRAGHSQPRESMALWRRVTELTDRLEQDEESIQLGLFSRMLQLEYAWRLGIEPDVFEGLVAEATEIATARDDLNSLALLKLLTTARPGAAATSSEWLQAVAEAQALADRSGEPALAVAVRAAGAYAQMCSGNLDEVEATAAEIVALMGDDPEVGAGVVIASPRAWANVAQAMAQRERGNEEEAERLIEAALAETAAREDLETESWALGTRAQLLADRGDTEGALAIALRNRELTERLGDVFSRTIALTSLAYVELEAGEFEAALVDVELADRGYREAMGTPGEMAAWRGTMRARALLGTGRIEEALAQAEEAVAGSRQRGMAWQLPPALLVLAQARAATDAAGACEALEEAAELARERGHVMSQRRIEATRDEVVPA